MLAEQIVDELLAKAADSRAVLLIDGGSGSGKTTLARQLVQILHHRSHPTQLVSLDDCYPGWDGLAAAAAMVPGMLRADNPGHPTWDWAANRTSGWRSLDPDQGLIVEGCGALTPTNLALATAGLWLEMDAEARKQRALARAQDDFEKYWDMWAAQERQHWVEHSPWCLADWVLHP